MPVSVGDGLIEVSFEAVSSVQVFEIVLNSGLLTIQGILVLVGRFLGVVSAALVR